MPEPLSAAVAHGRFGHGEEGRPIRPAADEVRAITENQADKLIAILDAVTAAPGKSAEVDSSMETFRSILAAYAQDFGDHSARQLEAYARRQASLDDDERAETGWSR